MIIKIFIKKIISIIITVIFLYPIISCKNENDIPKELNFNTPKDAIDFIIKNSNLNAEEVMKHDNPKWSETQKYWDNIEQKIHYNFSTESHSDGMRYYGNITPSNNVGVGSSSSENYLTWEFIIFNDGEIYCRDGLQYKKSESSFPSHYGKYNFSNSEEIGVPYNRLITDVEEVIWGDNGEGYRLGTQGKDTIFFDTYLHGKTVGRSIGGGKNVLRNGENSPTAYQVNEFRNNEGEFDGVQTYYDDCGRLLKKLIFDNGVEISSTIYSPRDRFDNCEHELTLHQEINYKNGLLDGVLISYEPRGYDYNSMTTQYGGFYSYPTTSETYVKGILNGKYIKYWRPSIFNTGIKTGTKVDPIQTGNKQEEGNYLDGEKDGLWTEYYEENGNVYSKGEYKNGFKKGNWTKYDKQGEITEVKDEGK